MRETEEEEKTWHFNLFPNDESDTASNAGHKSLDHDKSSFLIIKREQPSEGSKTKETGKGGE
jgi:hypothetical protein